MQGVAWNSWKLEGKYLLNLLFLIFFSDGLSVQTVVGMLYNPFSGYWHWSENTSLNYAAHAVKSGVQEHPVSAEFAFKGETEELQANACTNPAVHEELKKWIVSEDYGNMAWISDVFKYKKYIIYPLRENHEEKKANKKD